MTHSGFGAGFQNLVTGGQPAEQTQATEQAQANTDISPSSSTHSGFGAGFQDQQTGSQSADQAQSNAEISLPGTIVSAPALKAVLETLAAGGCKFWVAKSQDISEQYPEAIEDWRAAGLVADGYDIVIADHEHNLPLIIRRRKERDAEDHWVFDIEAM